MEGLRNSMTRGARALAPAILALDGAMLIVLGLVAFSGAMGSAQGEFLLLLIGGMALIVFGLMIVIRWQLAAAKTGLVGLAAGYFAAALSEFEVATDPCDIGAALAACATDVVKGTPWEVYQGPLVLAVLAFVVLALEPFVSSEDARSDASRSAK